MNTRTKDIHVIFQSRNGEPSRNDGWLDYCREEPKYHGISDDNAETWAKAEADKLSRRLGCECRYRIEFW